MNPGGFAGQKQDFFQVYSAFIKKNKIYVCSLVLEAICFSMKSLEMIDLFSSVKANVFG